MILHINTTKEKGQNIEIKLKENNKIIDKKNIKAARQQSEKLLFLLDKILKKNNFDLNKIRAIEVVNQGGTFTSLRIGIVTANALAYALNIPVYNPKDKEKKTDKNKYYIVKPEYNREPFITKPVD